MIVKRLIDWFGSRMAVLPVAGMVLLLTVGCAKETPLVEETIDLTGAEPTGFIARFDQTRTAVEISWTDNSNGKADFELEREAGDEQAFRSVAILPAGTTSYIDQDVHAGSDYSYRIRTFKSGNSTSAWSVVAETADETVRDVDGNVYKICRIGDQVWMASNLMVTHYSDGTPITDGTGTGALNERDPASYWFAYDDDTANIPTYGLLYTWDAMMRGHLPSNASPSGVQGACPDGWHIPGNGEWDRLVKVLYGASEAGGKLKESGTGHWTPINVGATDEWGFHGLPAGFRLSDGRYALKGSDALFWTSGAQWQFVLGYETPEAKRTVASSRTAGLSVRCVRNQ